MNTDQAAIQLAADIAAAFTPPTQQETSELTTLALELATKTFAEWKAACEAKYPDFPSNLNHQAAIGAAVATAGVLCITTALINMEENLALRMLALEEVIESAPTYLVAGITIDKLNQMVAAEKAAKAVPGSGIVQPAHPGFRD